MYVFAYVEQLRHLSEDQIVMGFVASCVESLSEKDGCTPAQMWERMIGKVTYVGKRDFFGNVVRYLHSRRGVVNFCCFEKKLYICKKVYFMNTAIKQTAFKFDADLTRSMKHRAKSLGKTVNGYVRDLISSDLEKAEMLPRVSLEGLFDEDVEKLDGVMKSPDMAAIMDDPRAKAIWER